MPKTVDDYFFLDLLKRKLYHSFFIRRSLWNLKYVVVVV